MTIRHVLDQLDRIYLGKPEITKLCCTALLANGHILLEDVPGTGKTLLAKSIAKSFEADFARIQFTADLLPSDIIGSDFFNMQTQTFENRTGPIFTNILLIDEVNRAVPRTQSALLEAMEERQVSIGGVTYQLPKPFFVIADRVGGNVHATGRSTRSLPHVSSSWVSWGRRRTELDSADDFKDETDSACLDDE